VSNTYVRWLVAVLAALAILALLAYQRNDPGVGGRVPDPEDAMVALMGRWPAA
jgi:hypothetical protein